jgi:hypothetical protein
MRNAVAATTTPERLEPDPARACPAPMKEIAKMSNRGGLDGKRNGKIEKDARRQGRTCEMRGAREIAGDAETSARERSKAAKVSVCAKTVEAANTDGIVGENGCAAVQSVAELTVIICGDPDNRKKRLNLPETLRERGLDEAKMATIYVGLAEKLCRNKEQGAVGVAAAKLLFEVLKELTTHWLEPQKSADDSDPARAPQFVRLIHNVPRPVRE